MKRNYLLLTLVFAAGLAFTAGCSKQEQPAPAAQTEKPVAPEKTAPASTAVHSAVADMQKTADTAASSVQTQAAAVQATADKAVTDAQTNVPALTSQTQSLIEKVKALLAANKPADALPILSQLASAKLTPEQQTMVNDLTQKAQQMLQQGAASKAADAVGGLLKK